MISKLTDFVPNSWYGSTKRESVSKYEDRQTDRDTQTDRERESERRTIDKKKN